MDRLKSDKSGGRLFHHPGARHSSHEFQYCGRFNSSVSQEMAFDPLCLLRGSRWHTGSFVGADPHGEERCTRRSRWRRTPVTVPEVTVTVLDCAPGLNTPLLRERLRPALGRLEIAPALTLETREKAAVSDRCSRRNAGRRNRSSSDLLPAVHRHRMCPFSFGGFLGSTALRAVFRTTRVIPIQTGLIPLVYCRHFRGGSPHGVTRSSARNTLAEGNTLS